MEWIAAKDRLPENGQRVLVHIYPWGPDDIYSCTFNHWFSWHVDGDCCKNEGGGVIFNWMPLPTAPEKPELNKKEKL